MDSLIRLISDSIAFWAAATLAIVVVLLFLLLRGRKLRSPGQSKRTSNWRVLSCYADTHPSFVYVLKSLRRKNRLEELLQDDEMRQALDCLRRWQRSASSTEKVSVLDLAVGRKQNLSGSRPRWSPCYGAFLPTPPAQIAFRSGLIGNWIAFSTA